MRGFLIRDEDSWRISYQKEGKTNWTNIELLPEDIKKHKNILIDLNNEEVQFEIVTSYKIDDSQCCKHKGKKSIDCEYFVSNGINECLMIDVKQLKYAKLIQKKEMTWKTFFNEIPIENKSQFDNNILDYLDENFENPSKKNV